MTDGILIGAVIFIIIMCAAAYVKVMGFLVAQLEKKSVFLASILWLFLLCVSVGYLWELLWR